MQTGLCRLGRRGKTLAIVIISLGLGCLLALLPILPGAAISVADVPKPSQVNRAWVVDMADMLSPASEAEIDRMVTALEAVNGTELAVVTVLDTQAAASPKAFATELFNTWGIGKAGTDNGVLFLVSKGDRRTEVETGYGVEGALSDAKIGSILENHVTPQFKAGNFDAGILAGTAAMVSSLKGETFERAPLVGTQPSPNTVSAPEQNDPIRAVFSIIFWLGVSIGFIVLTIRLSKLVTGQLLAVEIEPIGRSNVVGSNNDYDLGLWTIRLLVGERLAVEKGLTYKRAVLLSQYDEPEVSGSWLIASRQQEQLARRGWELFWWFLTLWTLFFLLLKDLVVIESIFAFVWLCCELWFYAQDLQSRSDTKGDGWLPAVIRLTAISAIGILMLLVFRAVSDGWIVWPLLAAFFSVCAALLRWVRSLPKRPQAICEVCSSSMQRLTTQELDGCISRPERVEIQLESALYEGWHCATCVSARSDDDLSIHLVSHILNKKGYSQCTACDALTLETAAKTHRPATRSQAGRRTVMRLCHSCGGHSKKTLTIPKLVPVKSSYHSDHTSSSSHSTSFSSHSTSSSSHSSHSPSSRSEGKSFGGGSSGGGGAGSSW